MKTTPCSGSLCTLRIWCDNRAVDPEVPIYKRVDSLESVSVQPRSEPEVGVEPVRELAAGEFPIHIVVTRYDHQPIRAEVQSVEKPARELCRLVVLFNCCLVSESPLITTNTAAPLCTSAAHSSRTCAASER